MKRATCIPAAFLGVSLRFLVHALLISGAALGYRWGLRRWQVLYVGGRATAGRRARGAKDEAVSGRLLLYWGYGHSRRRALSTETPKQKLRRLLDRLGLDPEKKREFDALIEESDDEDAAALVAALDDVERENPGAIDQAVEHIKTHGIPDDDD